MSFLLPRYDPRSLTAQQFADENPEDPEVWFANFLSVSTFTVGWPVATSTLRFGLGLMGIMTVRRA